MSQFLHRGRMQKQLARVAVASVLLSASCSEEKKSTKQNAPMAEPVQTTQKSKPVHSAKPTSSTKTESTASKTSAPKVKPKPPKKTGCPTEMARVSYFCIDKWEVHLVDKKDGTVHPFNKSPTRNRLNLKAVSAPDVFPQGHMSQISAKATCKNAGKRLCKKDEWQKACTGPKKTKFPHGNKRDEWKCNIGKEPYILDLFFPDIPHLKRAGAEFNDERLLLQPGYLTKTGDHYECTNAYGVFDMDGNLSEWIEGGEEVEGIQRGWFMGDPFSGKGISGCYRQAKLHADNYLDYSTGTRCCINATR